MKRNTVFIPALLHLHDVNSYKFIHTGTILMPIFSIDLFMFSGSKFAFCLYIATMCFSDITKRTKKTVKSTAMNQYRSNFQANIRTNVKQTVLKTLFQP